MALSTETWWTREYEPPALATLTNNLRTHYGVTRSMIGCKGDENHLRGYHRSREWILNSGYSAYGEDDYSVTSGLDKGGDARWLCAFDLQTRGGVPELIEICKRLGAAVRADRFPQIREWYGNADGDKVVDGWDNLRDRAASSDSSHLWHLHISFFRSRADWDHSQLFDVITGDDMDVRLYRLKGRTEVWLYDGNGRRWIPNPATLARVQAATGVTTIVDVASQADLDLIAPLPPAAVPPALAARLDPILAAALDDGDVTVVMDDASRGELLAIRAAIGALPAAVVDEFAHELVDSTSTPTTT